MSANLALVYDHPHYDGPWCCAPLECAICCCAWIAVFPVCEPTLACPDCGYENAAPPITNGDDDRDDN